MIAAAGGVTACSSPASEDGSAPVTVTPLLGAVDGEAVAAQYGEAVWRVETEGCDWLGVGSAFAIDAHHLVTNHHVIANDTSPRLRSPDGHVRDGRVVGASVEPDIAVIEVAEELPLVLPFADTASLQPAEPVVVMGYPIPSNEFTYAVGSLVAFVGDGEALLSDAPIDKGNSGGPAVRSDGTVAGVVTQMSLADPSERVAIIFTAATLQPAIDHALADPTDVLSDCGFGPDYVPQVPEKFAIEAPPPPPTSSSTTQITTTTTKPQTTTSTLPIPTIEPHECPTGVVELTLDTFTAEPTADVSGEWTVTASGQFVNLATAPVVNRSVTAYFPELRHTVSADVDPAPLEVSGVRDWTLSGSVPSGEQAPAEPSLSFSTRWADQDDFFGCLAPVKRHP